MFQYMFGYTLSRKYSTFFFIDEYKFKFILNEYFVLSKRHILPKRFTKTLEGFLKKNKEEDIFEEINYRIDGLSKDNFVYNGFFQSNYFFKNYSDEISQIFRIKKSYQKEIKNLFKLDPQKKNIVIHFRRSDYSYAFKNYNLGASDLTLPLSYYNNCLSIVKEVENSNIIILSDDIEGVKKDIKSINLLNEASHLFFSNYDQITDLQILMQADVLILSSSSFAWWGAYLNNVAIQIMVPQYWLGFHLAKEFPSGIIFEKWEQISVF